MQTPLIAPEVNEAFVTATIVALQELAETVAIPGGPRPAEAEGLSGDLFAVIALRRSKPGEVVLALPLPVIEAIARRYLPAEEALSPELLEDVAGEFANVIAGQAKTMLKGTPYHFLLSTPQAGRTAPPPSDGPAALLPFETDAGAFAIRIELPACEGEG